ncbi:hypothetical protein LCGC14_0225220 [marine sediment metagenome]|uniref:Uncharacterized protein n=1 Tax=marine sediment metagenome TaxID=412755 RepID=A0A0F9XG95_9ZZZZ
MSEESKFSEWYKTARKNENKKLIMRFLEDFEKVVSYFKLDGHLVSTIRAKWVEMIK